MRFAIGLARANVDHGTGGPFGAVVFDRHNNRLVAPGVSLFVTTNCTVAHAEMVAIILAQRSIEHFDSALKGNHPTSWLPALNRAPCASAPSLGRAPVTLSVERTTKTPGPSASTKGRNHSTGSGSWSVVVSPSHEMCAAKKLPRYFVTMLKAVVRSTTPEGETSPSSASLSVAQGLSSSKL